MAMLATLAGAAVAAGTAAAPAAAAAGAATAATAAGAATAATTGITMAGVAQGIGAAASLASIGTSIAGIKSANAAGDKQISEAKRQNSLAKKDVNREKRQKQGAIEARAHQVSAGGADLQGDLEAQAFENFSRLDAQTGNVVSDIKAQKKAATLGGVGNILGTATGSLFAAAPLIAG